MAPFHAMAELKQTAQAKILISPILIRKGAPPIHEICLSLNSSFFMSQNDYHLGNAINFNYVSPPFLHF